ncbi:membrane-spanning 4-domains subfamily A member 6D-like [Gracilinanus agilis]|uniref:membrane-spanning 4-domains subfamily A member 6D-like n=1 Tax=Gracilinanus agilis TaxID=191870 RepID=UPI001CFCDB59|nr:membrane-spanning 4-domains subfamily A member 6D-like [Gracilinanus agilis]
MTSQPVPPGMFMIVTPNGISIPQTGQPGPSSESNNNLKKGLKEESKALGTVQILNGAMILSLGIILASIPSSTFFQPSYSKVVHSCYPFIGGVSFIISGSLSIAAEKKKIKSLSQVSLAANVICGIEATAGFLLLAIVLPEMQKGVTQCIEFVHNQDDTENQDDDYRNHFSSTPSVWACYMAGRALLGTLSVLLILTGLELSITLFEAIFGWKRMSSEYNGRVLFLPHGRHTNSGLKSVLSERGYEELGASS